MESTLKEKLYIYKDMIRAYEQLKNLTMLLYLINANIMESEEIEKNIDKIENICIKELDTIKEILIDKLNLKDKLNKNVLSKITLDDILQL